jgi:DNA-binding NarL/FixJ family response regulator
MERMPDPARPQRIRLGGPLRVLLVVENAQLLLRLSEVVRSIEGLHLAGAFTTAIDVVDWTVWDRHGWHFAFIDLGMRQGGTREVVTRLLEDARPGTLVALGDHLWREIRAECETMGIHHLLEKGDVIAFRGFLEEQVR